MKRLTVILLLSVACFGQLSTVNISGGALAGKLVYPTNNSGGTPIQYNFMTFGGKLAPGSYSGAPCGALTNCYGLNGSQWQFNATGPLCPNMCSYNSTSTTVSLSITTLPDGSTTEHVSASMYGTFVGPGGKIWQNVMAYFNSDTNPAIDGVTVMAPGGLVVVLQDN